MALSPQQQIQLEHLLLQREAAYARVYALEVAVTEIFGDEFPFPASPEPVAASSQGRKKAPPKGKGASTAARPTALKIRPLEPGESAYRVEFSQGNVRLKELHLDRKSLQALLQSEAGESSLQRIETVDADSKLLEVIYRREETDTP
ncbi:hypothetical protein H5P28_07610 [Ruficoccus amylovorans]|uniref:Uncharacterized protein n=1 Tax=Ruficoccus amylovorans TaxID=1804625 RepID=A0A842HEX7_9BACT|nr:hypothetical protein [Ruficoccus amylovorans]MBC2594127.1 hypothetical protein [Ruficoccus amylovorans]